VLLSRSIASRPRSPATSSSSASSSSRVIVELDGRGPHETHAAFDTDRERDRILQAGGWRVARVTWRHLHREVDELEADLRLLLRGET
jgi:very-short-patch-repair endonuclease